MTPFPPTLISDAESLKRAVAFGKANGKKSLIVDLDLLDLILRGEVPVGGNELPPEEVTARLYEVKKKLADTTRELGATCGELSCDDCNDRYSALLLRAEAAEKQCPKCLTPISGRGLDSDGGFHPGKKCREVIAASKGYGKAPASRPRRPAKTGRS